MAFRLVKLCAFGAPDCTAQRASLSSRVSRQACDLTHRITSCASGSAILLLNDWLPPGASLGAVNSKLASIAPNLPNDNLIAKI